MAPARPASRKQAPREADYSNIGVAGRKTGIVLKDSGVRDEHGMEPIDGIFSSPEKTPAQQRRSDHSTLTNESEMDIAHSSTIPDPTDFLRTGHGALPPPRSRSPIKTHLGSPARRSTGPASSPSKRPAPDRSSPVASSPQIPSSPLPAESPSSRRHAEPVRRVGLSRNTGVIPRPVKKRTFDLNVSEDEEPPVDNADPELTSEIPALNGDDSLPLPADESMEIPKSDDDEEEEMPPPSPPQRSRATKGKGAAKAPKDKPKKPTKQFQAPGKPSKKRGRPPKNPAAVDEDRPAKRPKQTTHRPATPEADEPQASASRAAVSTPERKGHKKPAAVAKRRGPIPSTETGVDSKVTWPGTDRTKPRARGLRILRSETPAADSGATVMRSGRTSVKPMAYWRNERLIYGDGRIDGNQIQLPGIKEVIRTEELSPDPRPRPKGRPGRKKRAQEIIEDDEDIEEWETEPGYLEASVPRWDPSTGRVSEDQEDEIEIAYAPKGLELATREVKNATFLYGKTLSLPFFHSGIVDLPPGGEKRPKNSRVNHIVFWVFAGRVDVNVSDNEFSIGRGGMWQVPRGNFYSLRNSYDRPARVFFAQGCYMQEEEAAGGSEE